MPSDSKTRVVSRGIVFSAWEKLSVRRSLETVAGSFSLTCPIGARVPFRPGSRIDISRGTQKLFVGHVDSMAVEKSDGTAVKTFAGRDLTADLVDCTLPFSMRYELAHIDFFTLLLSICGKFDLLPEFDESLRERIESTTFPFLARDATETVFTFLDRAARIAGLPLYSRTGERLTVGIWPDKATVDLAAGRNVESYSVAYDTSGLHSEVDVIGQIPSVGKDFAAAVLHSPPAISFDRSVERYRPLLVQAESASTPEMLQKRAEWETAVRAARATTVEVVTNGWEQYWDHDKPGPLWKLGMSVKTTIPDVAIDETLLVGEIEYAASNRGEGTTTTMKLKRADAFLPEPYVNPATNPLVRLVGQIDNTDAVQFDAGGGGG